MNAYQKSADMSYYNDTGYRDVGPYSPHPTCVPIGANVVRSTWKVWPPTKAEATEIEIPVSAIYNPFVQQQAVNIVNYEPVRNRTSGVVLHPVCSVDFRSKIWNDPISGSRNPFPPHYAEQISESNLPIELQSPSIDYLLPNIPPQPTNYCFVIDSVLYREELEQMRDTLQQAIGLLPENANVALITFGSIVNVHALGFNTCIKTFVFRGNSEVTLADVRTALRLNPAGNRGPDGKFLCRLADVEENLTAILDGLEIDSWPTHADQRSNRATGTALATAIGLFETLVPNSPARIMLFNGGVATHGLGATASKDLSEPIRQHQHLSKSSNELKLYKSSCSYYQTLATRAVNAGFVVDLFACALDQTGLAEMRVLAERTGGICVMTDTFSLNVFRDTLKEIVKINGCHSASAYNVRIELLCSKGIAVAGAIGCITGTGKAGPQVSSTTVGESNTCEWRVGVLHPSSTIAFYFDITNTSASLLRDKQAFLQFQVSYTSPTGERRMRVHTCTYNFGDGSRPALSNSFDQEAATVAIARLAVYRAENEETLDTLRWLDRKLIRVTSLFGDYTKDQPDSFKLPPEFSYYPTFMYQFRRGPFIETINNSPDETAFYRLSLLKENLVNTITMISPSLLQYDPRTLTPQPVGLDSAALREDCVLLMDSFFHVVLWHGASIARWKEQGYHEQEDYKYLKILLTNPVSDANMLLKSKLPCPKFVTCCAGGSQERFLLARVNPSVNSRKGAEDSVDGAVLSEEVNVNTFMEHLAAVVTRG